MLRKDFVSNSSSSSFVLDSNQKGLKDFFKEFKKLFGKLHNIICIFNTRKDLVDTILKTFESYTEVQNWIKENKISVTKYISDERSTISFAPQMLLDDKLLDICWMVIIEPCDQIELCVFDTWGDYNFAMHQILTLLEYKGFNFEDGYTHEGWTKMNLENKVNVND